MTGVDDAELEAARTALSMAVSRAGGVAVLSGAGMSAESGIPTFRDALTGLWARFDPMELASEEGFRSHPQRVWDWYAERREGVRRALPNAGHRALADFQAAHPGVLTVITQNVDDLHQRAGCTAAIRLHGDILQDRWLEPCPRTSRSPACETDWANPGRPPRCAECGNLVRPAVVWFGEPLPLPEINAAEHAVDHASVLLVVGTSGVVWPAAGLAARARRAGTQVVIINPEPSDIDREAQILLRATAAQALPALLEGL